MIDDKTALLAEVEALILQLSRREPPDLDTIAQLDTFKTEVETANAAELDDLIMQWKLAGNA